MSNIQKIKDEQGYIPKLIPNTCGNCANRTSEMVQVSAPTTWKPKGYWVEQNVRCSIGGFTVQKIGTCKVWGPKV